MKTINSVIILLLFLNISFAKTLTYCPTKKIDVKKIKQLIRKQNKNVYRDIWYGKKKNGDYFISIHTKDAIEKYAQYNENGTLKFAGIQSYNDYPIGIWCYKKNNRYIYKNFDKPLTKKEQQVIEFYKKLLKEKPIGSFRVYQTYKNIIGIDFFGFIIFIDIDQNKIIKALYINGYDKKDKRIDNKKLKIVNNCIKKAIKNYKTKKEIENICNLNFNIIVPDYCS